MLLFVRPTELYGVLGLKVIKLNHCTEFSSDDLLSLTFMLAGSCDVSDGV